MQKMLHIDANKCTGCLQCEMACSFENYGIFAPAKSRIKVFDFHDTGKKVPYTFTQCDEATDEGCHRYLRPRIAQQGECHYHRRLTAVW